jgi:ABC-type nitrate/sulfonate/bicarbonate transport system substrate-binding protein
VRLRNWDDGRVFTHYEGCWDSHPVCAILLAADAIEAQQAEIERLRRWKAEATEVLKGWDAVANMVPVRLGDRKSDAVAAEIIRLRQEINRLTALRIADRMLPQRHGWRKRRG